MPYNRRLVLSLLLAFLASPACPQAGETGRSQAEERPPVYQPPDLGAPSPSILVGGGTRTMELESDVDLVALAPKPFGLSASPEPTLYWWNKHSSPFMLSIGIANQSSRVKFSFSEPGGAEADAAKPGRLALGSQGFRLKKNLEYQWTVAPAGKPHSGARSTGVLVYRAPPPELQNKLAHSNSLERSRLYAEAGYWYDAVQTLWESIEADPENSAMQREQLLILLAGAGLELPEIVESLAPAKRQAHGADQR